jgi:septum formation protein
VNARLDLPLFLASRSPRRRAMLAEAGVPVEVRASLDDGDLARGDVAPSDWAMALAYLKARWVRDELAEIGAAGTVIGADTVCVLDADAIGQPRDAAEARRMLESFQSREHEVVTGVCILDVETGERTLFADEAVVTWGTIPTREFEAYLAGGHWRGKAGAYSLIERVEAGWPITCDGDPATVMGLPMRRLLRLLAPHEDPR